ncbi:MAG: hypothetical protein K2X41_12040 [Hyphomicrobium sp.]|nr:hypothetical protein [Hyphomicrobium sp.]
MYRTLNAERIVATLVTLQRRVGDRFPRSGLTGVCGDVVELAKQTTGRIAEVGRPHWALRFGVIATVVLGVTGLALVIGRAVELKGTDELSDVMQGLDSAVNLTVILGGAAFFLSTIETRWKRNKALTALHELRSIVHVIDMHQLTKDPSMLGGARTSSSPDHDLTPFELMRYLDYCSELLSLTAKLAALYAEKLSDPVVVDTVGDIERLTSGLSSKIWQKITIVQSLEGRELPPAIPPPVFKPSPV